MRKRDQGQITRGAQEFAGSESGSGKFPPDHVTRKLPGPQATSPLPPSRLHPLPHSPNIQNLASPPPLNVPLIPNRAFPPMTLCSVAYGSTASRARCIETLFYDND